MVAVPGVFQGVWLAILWELLGFVSRTGDKATSFLKSRISLDPMKAFQTLCLLLALLFIHGNLVTPEPLDSLEDRNCASDGKEDDGPDVTVSVEDFLESTHELEESKIQSDLIRSSVKRPIWLIPGMASSQLTSWKYFDCPGLPDIEIGDRIW